MQSQQATLEAIRPTFLNIFNTGSIKADGGLKKASYQLVETNYTNMATEETLDGVLL